MTFQVNLSLISSYISIIWYQTCFFQRDIKNAGPFQRGKIYTKALWQFFCHNRVFKTDSLLGFHSFRLVITERYYIPSKIPYIPGITLIRPKYSQISHNTSVQISLWPVKAILWAWKASLDKVRRRPTLKFTILL